MKSIRIAVLCSGGGTNLEAILGARERGALPHGEVVLVVADSKEAYAVERAKQHHVEAVVFDKREYPREARENAILNCLKAHDIGLVVLAGFMTVLSSSFVKAYEGRIVNIHPALLPSFGGVGMYGLHVHEAALARGVKVTGATVHFVTEECDGGPIIMQKAVRVLAHDTPETLQKRVMREAEWVIYPKAIEEVCKGISGETYMKTKGLGEAVGASRYPGRGIVVGKTADGKRAFFAYFIMGRSENSRNRVFAEYGDEVKTEPFDESKVKDPSLIIYSPVKRVKNDVIVTNGDQTDTIEQYLQKGVCFRRGLQERTFEPDAPNFTPRISAVLHLGEGKDYTYEMSILKCADGEGKKCNRYFYLYEPVSGAGHFLHTYQKDGDPLPSFEGEPELVAIGDDFKTMAREIWEHLDAENKISLVCRSIDLKTGKTESVLFNKYTK